MHGSLHKDPDQLDLLREFMKLQKEMMIMLLSMLEGNVVNGPIGKQMVDTLVESSANFEVTTTVQLHVCWKQIYEGGPGICGFCPKKRVFGCFAELLEFIGHSIKEIACNQQ